MNLLRKVRAFLRNEYADCGQPDMARIREMLDYLREEAPYGAIGFPIVELDTAI